MPTVPCILMVWLLQVRAKIPV